MVNIDDFIKRLEFVLDYYNLSASAFADRINVQRSSLSHLLSGRNKPSLDFIIKVIEVFPEVDLYWILNGKGTFPKSDKSSTSNKPNLANEFNIQTIETNSNPSLNLSSTMALNTNTTPSDTLKTLDMNKNSASNIERIVVFYRDGTFKNYES
ncbi:helix-turn-helix domain-containing protein [Flavobacterium sp.]|jgi:transcriptional regulator with XRE-family HTH domain|uniref:helix-turn-helix domain-containing protein n=1 Tax=Flavobacterium sp. TaxID=239 RepID=UPI0037C16412